MILKSLCVSLLASSPALGSDCTINLYQGEGDSPSQAVKRAMVTAVTARGYTVVKEKSPNHLTYRRTEKTYSQDFRSDALPVKVMEIEFRSITKVRAYSRSFGEVSDTTESRTISDQKKYYLDSEMVSAGSGRIDGETIEYIWMYTINRLPVCGDEK